MIRPKVRVSQLAGELRCKAKDILEALSGLGIEREQKITHNTRLEAEEADKIKSHFASLPDLHEPKTNHVTLGHAKSIAARFGEEI